MNSIIPPVLAPFITQCIRQPSLTLLTSVLDTSTNWLLARFLVTALRGTKSENAIVVGRDTGASAERDKVVLVSIWRSFQLWVEIARKNGLDLQDAVAQGKLCYVDGLSVSSESDIPGSAYIISLKSLTIQDLNATISTVIQRLSSQVATSRTIILMDGLDFLLACQPNLQSIELLQTIVDLQHRVHSIILTCAADSPFLHSVEATTTPLELEHAIYTRTLAHQARLVFQLRPLETGHSREVSGTVRVSQGGAWDTAEDSTNEPEEGEWLYHVKSDGFVKIWGRGEA